MINQGMPLSMVKAGEVVTIVGNTGGRLLQKRLADMGLNPGIQVKVINNQMSGPVLIDLKGSRVGLGRGLAQKILVKSDKEDIAQTS